MNKIKVTMINHSEHYSDEYLSGLVRITYSEKLNGKQDIAEQLLDYENQNTNLIDNCVKFNHTSILEHVSYTFMIEGASRSLLSQITRHRLFSFTSGSQHYIDYSKIGRFEVPVELLNQPIELQEKYEESLQRSMEDYKKLIEMGIDHSVARQVLPNAMRNNLVMTGNLREWCHFLNLRLCGRNTSEIQYIAYLIYEELKKYNPVIINQVGPDCIQKGKCTQGHKSCGIVCSEYELMSRFSSLKENEE